MPALARFDLMHVNGTLRLFELNGNPEPKKIGQSKLNGLAMP